MQLSTQQTQPDLLNQTDLARLFKVNKSTVSRQVQTLKLSPKGTGPRGEALYSVAEYKAARAHDVDPLKQYATAALRPTASAEPPAGSYTGLLDDDDAEDAAGPAPLKPLPGSINVERTALVREQRIQKERENRAAEGQLLVLTEVLDRMADAGASLRQLMQDRAPQLATDLAAATDQRARLAVIERHDRDIQDRFAAALQSLASADAADPRPAS